MAPEVKAGLNMDHQQTSSTHYSQVDTYRQKHGSQDYPTQPDLGT
jgi:hypothetical protein